MNVIEAYRLSWSFPSEQTQPSLPVPQNAEMGTHPPEWGDCPFSLFSLRFPLLSRRRIKSYKFIISQPLIDNSSNYVLKASRVNIFAAVEAEGLFIKITSQMTRLNADISPFDCPLQKTPEVLNTIGMDVSSYISLSMVNNFMDILLVQIAIWGQRICDKVTASFNGFAGGGWEKIKLGWGWGDK